VLVIDTRSVAFSTVLMLVVMFIALFAYWMARRTYAGFGWWVASIGVSALTVLVFTLRGVYDVPWLGSLASQLLALAWAATVVVGTLYFFGRSARDPLTWGVTTGGAVAMIAGRLLLIPDVVSIALGSFAIGLLMLRAAWILKDEATPQVRTAARICALVLLAFGLARFWRAGYLFTAEPGYDILSGQAASVLNYTFNLAFATLWSFAFLFLNSSRIEAELLGSRVEVSRLVGSDALTGVANRAAFFEAGAQWFARAQRGHTALSVIVIAVDHLRQVNTEHGHAVGDGVLSDVANEIATLSPPSDLVARVSGEEFAVLLPESNAEHAKGVAERLCIQIASRAVSGSHLSITASIGVATRVAEDANFEHLFRRAEQGLARAKAAGRNRVAVA
jgi:diguanylate cyclase (GGDEF)-like protein